MTSNTNNSSVVITTRNNKNQIPILQSTEVGTFDEILGSGGFCEVSEIRNIQLHSNDNGEQRQLPSSTNDALSKDAREKFNKRFENYEETHHSKDEQNQLLDRMQTHSYDTNNKNSENNFKTSASNYMTKKKNHSMHGKKPTPPKIVLKQVKGNLDEKRCKTAVRDLFAEASVLAKCSHPNIISLYAIGCDNDNNESEQSTSESTAQQKAPSLSKPSKPQKSINFIIIDKLNLTVRSKIFQWKINKGIGPIWTKSQKALDYLWLERMLVVKKVADAIQYLHSKGFIHRDLTPDNIGFSSEGNTVKVFDFGLAKSIGRGRDCELGNDVTKHGGVLGDDNQVYHLSQNTGTLRYMSPEVALGKPYGFKVDVYSFALVMYEILNLVQPFSKLKESSSFTRTVIEGNLRPALDDDLPYTIQNLLKRMWSKEISERPSSKEVALYLEELFRGDEYGLFPPGHVWRHGGGDKKKDSSKPYYARKKSPRKARSVKRSVFL